jgi:hypothetical protein
MEETRRRCKYMAPRSPGSISNAVPGFICSVMTWSFGGRRHKVGVRERMGLPASGLPEEGTRCGSKS